MITAILSAETIGSREVKAEYVLAPEVVLLLVQDGTARLLDLGGNFYAICTTGASMLYEALQRDAATVAHQIAVQYSAEVQQVQSDLRAFLENLEQKGLISRREHSRHADTRKPIVPSLVLMPVLRCIHAWMASVKMSTWALLTLAYLSIRLFGWPRTIRVWQHFYHMHPVNAAALAMENKALAIDEAIRAGAANHLFNISCKERALCCWALLRFAGLPARLVLGADLFPLSSHCWCQLGAFVLSDDADRCERFTPVFSYE